jgi:hypothetical protein
MATSEEYAAWIVKNADKRGTPEFETVARAYRASRSEPTATPDPEEKGYVESLGAGLGKGFGQVVLGAQGLVGKGVEAVGGLGQDKSITDLITPRQPNIVQRAGQWLQDDAAQGRSKIEGELAPYKAANPITATAGELGGQVAATYPVGGLLGFGAKSIGLTRLGNALASGGMTTGAPVAQTLLARSADLGLRSLGGAVTGGASAALVDSEAAVTGAVLGGLLPGATLLAGSAGSRLADLGKAGARKMMQSAVKPTLQQLKTGEADTAIQALLDLGINPTARGVEKLRALIDDLNAQVDSRIAGSTATVPKQDVLNALAQVRGKFGNQVSPTADLSAIQRVADDFAAHPAIVPDIPVQVAQDLKQGTYSVLRGKYGQMGSAETEAQKALARGLKEGVGRAVPEVVPLNAQEARLIKALSVVERRALMDLNKNPMGLAALAGNPAGFVAFMADRSAAFKSIAARLVNAASKTNPSGPLIGAANNPLLRNAALISAESNP